MEAARRHVGHRFLGNGEQLLIGRNFLGIHQRQVHLEARRFVGLVLPAEIGVELAGLVCAWLSDQWTRTEKWIATAIASTCLIVPIVAAVALVAVRTSS